MVAATWEGRVLEKRTLLQQFEAVAEVVAFGSPDVSDGDITHWCWKDRGVSPAGVPRGAGPCCCNIDETLEKIVAPLANSLIHTAWAPAAESRWTQVCTGMRRVLTGFLAQTGVARMLAPLAGFLGRRRESGGFAVAAGSGRQRRLHQQEQIATAAVMQGAVPSGSRLEAWPVIRVSGHCGPAPLRCDG